MSRKKKFEVPRDRNIIPSPFLSYLRFVPQYGSHSTPQYSFREATQTNHLSRPLLPPFASEADLLLRGA